MTLVRYGKFPQHEREDFENVCRTHQADPTSFDVMANEEHFPLGNGQYRIDRIVSVKRDNVIVELQGSTWVVEFSEKFGLFRHRDGEN